MYASYPKHFFGSGYFYCMEKAKNWRDVFYHSWIVISYFFSFTGSDFIITLNNNRGCFLHGRIYQTRLKLFIKECLLTDESNPAIVLIETNIGLFVSIERYGIYGIHFCLHLLSHISSFILFCSCYDNNYSKFNTVSISVKYN